MTDRNGLAFILFPPPEGRKQTKFFYEVWHYILCILTLATIIPVIQVGGGYIMI